jgi:hypothetical protein
MAPVGPQRHKKNPPPLFILYRSDNGTAHAGLNAETVIVLKSSASYSAGSAKLLCDLAAIPLSEFGPFTIYHQNPLEM